MDGDTLSVERIIPAEAATIFAYLADASKHSAFDGSGTVRGVRGSSEPLRLGSEFGMSMRKGLSYSTTNTVVAFEQDRTIAWRTTGAGVLAKVVGGREWRYDLTPTDGGTLVRETWDLSHDKQAFLIKRSSMPASTRRSMEATLERLEQAVSGSSA